MDVDIHTITWNLNDPLNNIAPFGLPPDTTLLAMLCLAHTMHINRMISCNWPRIESWSTSDPEKSDQMELAYWMVSFEGRHTIPNIMHCTGSELVNVNFKKKTLLFPSAKILNCPRPGCRHLCIPHVNIEPTVLKTLKLDAEWINKTVVRLELKWSVGAWYYCIWGPINFKLALRWK